MMHIGNQKGHTMKTEVKLSDAQSQLLTDAVGFDKVRNQLGHRWSYDDGKPTLEFYNPRNIEHLRDAIEAVEAVVASDSSRKRVGTLLTKKLSETYNNLSWVRTMEWTSPENIRNIELADHHTKMAYDKSMDNRAKWNNEASQLFRDATYMMDSMSNQLASYREDVANLITILENVLDGDETDAEKGRIMLNEYKLTNSTKLLYAGHDWYATDCKCE